MKASLRAVLLAALLFVPLLPLAEAAGPEPRPWAPYNATSTVAALAMAREGTTIAAALREGVVTPTGVPVIPGGGPTVAETDLAVLDFDHGFARNASVQSTTPQGRTHVAVSRDGTTVATLGFDLQATVGSPETQSLKLYFARVDAGGNWSGSTPFERSVDLGKRDVVIPVDLAVSDDGRRVAALLRDGGNYVLRGYVFGGSSLDSAFELRGPGAPRALGASGDLSRLLLAGQFPEGNFTYGGAYVRTFSQSEALASFFDRSANNTDVRSAALSRDGSVAAIGGTDGRLHVFRSARTSLDGPATLTLGDAPVGNVTVSEDGTRIAGHAGLVLSHIDASTDAPSVLWNATLPGQNVTGVELNRTGGLVVAGTRGTGGGVYAFGDADNTVIWSVLGDTRGVAVDSAGTRVAYAQRATIGAATLPRQISLELTAGGKVSPVRTITAPGTTTFELNLRNDGAATEMVLFEEGSSEVSVSTQTPTVSVPPGAIRRVNLTVQVDERLVGLRVFNVSARSLTSGAIDNVTLAIEPQPTLDVTLQVSRTEVLAEAGKTSEVLLTIVNNGTGDASVGLRGTQTVSSGPLWNLTISETSLTALRGTRASVKVLMTPPPSVANGTSSTVQFTLEGRDIFDTATVVFRINPELEVEVNATGVTKFIEPGKKAFYNVTVANTGSLPRDFDLFYTIVSADGRNWGVDMQSQTARLEPLQRRVLPVSIVAPADALPNERVAVLVSARSIPELENETVVMDNVTLFGIAIPPKVTTTTPTDNIPFAAPLAVVAIFLLVSALLRRRDS